MDLLVRLLNIRNFVQMYLGKHSNKIKTNWNQWQEYTYIHKHNNNKQEILHSQARRESFSLILGRRIGTWTYELGKLGFRSWQIKGSGHSYVTLQYWSGASQILLQFIFYSTNVSSECSWHKGCLRKK